MLYRLLCIWLFDVIQINTFSFPFIGIVNVNVEETADGRIALRAYPTNSNEDINKATSEDDVDKVTHLEWLYIQGVK